MASRLMTEKLQYTAITTAPWRISIKRIRTPVPRYGGRDSVGRVQPPPPTAPRVFWTEPNRGQQTGRSLDNNLGRPCVCDDVMLRKPPVPFMESCLLQERGAAKGSQSPIVLCVYKQIKKHMRKCLDYYCLVKTIRGA